MASIAFAAPLIRSAIASLQAGMPTQIAAFNAEAVNTVVLKTPATYILGASDVLSAHEFPIVETAVIEGTLSGWSLQQAVADHLARVSVAVWTECGSGMIPAAYEESLGLARCVLEVLCQAGAFGDNAVLSDQESVFWRSDCLPADLTAPDRVVEKWRVPTFLTFPLEVTENFI